MNEYIEIEVPEGHFRAYRALPAHPPAPVVVVLQEIFGINEDMKETCHWLAQEGFIALCPDLFWRDEPGLELSSWTESEWQKGLQLYLKYDRNKGVADIAAAMAAGRRLPEASGKVGVMGFCLGGLMTFLTVARQGADAGAFYYGGETDKYLGESAAIHTPLLMHLAEEDEFIPVQARQAIVDSVSDLPNVEVHTYAGCHHAFARHNGAHYDRDSAQRANARTIAFLKAPPPSLQFTTSIRANIMSSNLSNKIALITGGSSGIGLAIAKRFVAEGACVFITGRRSAELDSAVTQIGMGVTAIQADSASLTDLDRVYETIKKAKGRIDILVANAGILEKAKIGSFTEEHFDRLFSVNVKGLVFTVQKALPLMPDGAAVILMSSTVAGKGLGDSSLYSATKAAIRNFARGWIVDLKDRKIRVNAISPGPINTPGLASGSPDAASAERVAAYLVSQVPLGRLGKPEDVANAVVFLASEQASYINGADIQIDGGWAQI